MSSVRLIETAPPVIPEMLRAAPVQLFVVWIDIYWGNPETWEMNSPPQPLSSALDEAARIRRQNWVVRVLPEGQTPRLDGLFESPD
jgi:hypothetical protein